VRGSSLAPRIRDGDFVLVSRVPLWLRRPAAGDVVVFHQPDYGQLIKRVERVLPDGRLFVRGEDIDSVDSRRFGPLPPRAVQGLVVAHIRPSHKGLGADS